MPQTLITAPNLFFFSLNNYLKMISTVRDTIKKFSMLTSGQRVLVAVSGGPDSMVMLHVLMELREELGIELGVAHLNHNLRGDESKRDLKFVKDRAAEEGLTFFGRTLRAGTLKKAGQADGPQAAARKKRLLFLHDVARRFKANRIAMGHTMDDQAETMIMRFMKGSGLAGLSGIWPVRGLLIKPLLETKRSEVMSFIEEQSIPYIVDSTNLKDSYLRNDIRHHLIPFIEEHYNPSIVESLARTAGVLRHDNDFIEALACHLGVVLKKTSKEVVLDGVRLREMHISLLTRVFLASVQALSKGSRINNAHIEAFVGLVKSGRPNSALTLPHGLHIRREYGRITLASSPASPTAAFDVRLSVPGSTVIKGVGTLKATLLEAPPAHFKKGAAYFDFSSIKGALKARSLAPGDRIIPLGMSGHRKVKDIFIDEKITPAGRAKIPIVCLGDELLWVAGVRQSEYGRVTGSTAETLMLELSKRGGRK
ncbi:MAG: tRNA lysidine(34) synthetase TilS [Thermodesulfobacteriota bacterium]